VYNRRLLPQTTSVAVASVLACVTDEIITIPASATSTVSPASTGYTYSWLTSLGSTYATPANPLSYKCAATSDFVYVQAAATLTTTLGTSLPAAAQIVVPASGSITTIAPSKISLLTTGSININQDVSIQVKYTGTPYALTVVWGDGKFETFRPPPYQTTGQTLTSTVTHQFAAVGTYSVAMTIISTTNAVSRAAQSVTIVVSCAL
jgi:hypothetical protein